MLTVGHLDAAAVNLPSGPAMLALAPVIVLIVGLLGFCLIDLIRSPAARYLPKPVWALVILFVSAPLGAITYLVFGRHRHGVAADTSPPVAPPVAPPSTPPITSRAPAAGFPDGDGGPAVLTRGLTRDHGGAGLFDVDLVVPVGGRVRLVGPNGAGKTTLLSIVTGLRRPDRGTVTIAVPRSRIAVVPDVPEGARLRPAGAGVGGGQRRPCRHGGGAAPHPRDLTRRRPSPPSHR